MDNSEIHLLVRESAAGEAQRNSRQSLYSVPRRFDMATIFVVTGAYSILLGSLSALHAGPIVMTALAIFISLVGVGQALLFRGLKPRLASTLVGICIFQFLTIGQWFYTPIPIGLMLVLAIVNILYGAILGYLIGTMVGGVFLVADLIRRRRLHRWRFSLRTLLIGTTVVAVVLGLVRWAVG